MFTLWESGPKTFRNIFLKGLEHQELSTTLYSSYKTTESILSTLIFYCTKIRKSKELQLIIN